MAHHLSLWLPSVGDEPDSLGRATAPAVRSAAGPSVPARTINLTRGTPPSTAQVNLIARDVPCLGLPDRMRWSPPPNEVEAAVYRVPARVRPKN